MAEKATAIKPRFSWPRGRYNGQRIVGLHIEARIDVTCWRLRWFGKYGECLAFGPLRLWISAQYKGH